MKYDLTAKQTKWPLSWMLVYFHLLNTKQKLDRQSRSWCNNICVSVCEGGPPGQKLMLFVDKVGKPCFRTQTQQVNIVTSGDTTERAGLAPYSPASPPVCSDGVKLISHRYIFILLPSAARRQQSYSVPPPPPPPTPPKPHFHSGRRG